MKGLHWVFEVHPQLLDLANEQEDGFSSLSIMWLFYDAVRAGQYERNMKD